MIKNIQYRVSADPRGKIKSGMRNEKGLPQSLDYFNISKFPELMKCYGLKPSVLIIFFPTDRISDFFDCNMILWNKTNTKSRFCDGEICYHRIAEEIKGVKYEAGQESPCVCKALDINNKEDAKKMCHYSAYFKAYVAVPQTGKVENPMCYLFETGSHNTGENILSELEKIKVLNEGRLLGVPFALSVKMISGKDAKSKFPIWTLTPIGLMSDIRNRSGFELPTAELVPGLALPEITEQHKKDIQHDNYDAIKTDIDEAQSRDKIQEIQQVAKELLKKEHLNQKQYEEVYNELNAKWKKIKQ
jgi:hypothetical protein